MTICEARKILGDVAKDMSDDDIQKLISTFQILSESWLDQYEIKIFGKTLKEIVEKV